MVTNDHEKAAYLVDARIKGKGERKFFDVRDDSIRQGLYLPKMLFD
jgi:hypothetical protein